MPLPYSRKPIGPALGNLRAATFATADALPDRPAPQPAESAKRLGKPKRAGKQPRPQTPNIRARREWHERDDTAKRIDSGPLVPFGSLILYPTPAAVGATPAELRAYSAGWGWRLRALRRAGATVQPIQFDRATRRGGRETGRRESPRAFRVVGPPTALRLVLDWTADRLCRWTEDVPVAVSFAGRPDPSKPGYVRARPPLVIPETDRDGSSVPEYRGPEVYDDGIPRPANHVQSLKAQSYLRAMRGEQENGSGI